MIRPRLGRLAASTLMILIGSALAHAADDKARPNVLVIVADDLGYGDLGFQGGTDVPTPNLDALAASGVRCSSGYVSGPYCSPTRAGLLTGRYQQRFGHEFNPGPAQDTSEAIGLSTKETTIADRFKEAGYKTGLVGKWHLGNRPEFQPTKRGFEEFYGFLGGAHPYVPGQRKKLAAIFRGTEEVESPTYLTDAFGEEAVAFVDRHKAQPFFLYLAFNAVHTPMQATDEKLKQFASIEDEKRRSYAGMLSSMDDAIGKVLGKLKGEGLEENTLVVFISDNGGPQANGSKNGPLRGQKATTWEGGVRVPFVVKWPAKLPAGKIYEQPVIQLDILPTALAAAGAEARGEIDGVNLLPYLNGEKSDAPHQSLYWRFGPQTAIRQGDWKLVKGAGVPSSLLFNLKTDIGEQTDLSSAEPDKVKELQTAWDSWNATLVEPAWKPARAKKKQDSKKPKKKQAT